MSDYIGLKLGNYHIARLIDRGGFANVYQGEHIYLKTPAAIKVLNMQLLDDALEKFLHEARIIASLEHPHIVRVLEFGVEGITPFLVMNYASNGTLRQHYPRKSTLNWSHIISYVKQVADALQYAHDHGVIHRDVKPENMLLDKNLQVQLSDFGLAVIDQNINTTTPSSAGTTAYMAPEQLQGQPCRASDQYALGIVVYEWLCGSGPFSGPEREMIIQHLYKAPPALRAKMPDISPAIEQVIMRALEKDPLARFATIQEFALALEQASPAKTLLDTGKERTPDHSAYEQATTIQQMTMPSPSTFLPQLPLMLYESSLTNNGRILQPSMGSSIYSVEGPSLTVTSSSSEDDDASHTSHTSATLPPPTPAPQRFPDLATPAFLHVTPGTEEKTVPPLALPPVQPATIRQRRNARPVALATLIGLAIIGLIVLASMVLWTQFTHNKSRASLTQDTVLPNYAPTSTVGGTTTLQRPGSPPPHASTPVTIPTTTAKTGILPGTTPIAGTHPTPIPTIGARPTPGTHPTQVPTTVPTPTPTAVIPLTVAFVNPPSTAVGGSIITIVTQADKGGVTIALRGKARSFGEITANSQGIASFLVKVPLLAKRVVLTATAIDGNGNEAQASQTIIVA
jgi:serine/threonine protein kinase